MRGLHKMQWAWPNFRCSNYMWQKCAQGVVTLICNADFNTQSHTQTRHLQWPIATHLVPDCVTAWPDFAVCLLICWRKKKNTWAGHYSSQPVLLHFQSAAVACLIRQSSSYEDAYTQKSKKRNPKKYISTSVMGIWCSYLFALSEIILKY